jgi:NAD(P)-dependent dehydrogenase (short-subunit alcohol dehydrogenase family)
MGMLVGKVVAVTGAGRGIGRAVAMLCAAEGARVVVNDLGGGPKGEGNDSGPAQDVAAEIRASGHAAVANTASVMDPQGAASIVEQALTAFGRIDAVVNNAGFLRDSIFHKMNTQDWDDVLRVHLSGCFYVSRAAAPHFKAQSSGAFVHFTSNAALLGNIGQSNYSAAKLGVVGLSTSIALDMQRYGVRSNCVAPTAWSRLTATVSPDTAEKQRRLELLRQMTPESIAPLVVYLCSEQAAEVTGQVFGVRGNEVFLYSRPTIVRTMHRSQGWSPQTCADILMPALKGSFQPLCTLAEAIPWDPQ